MITMHETPMTPEQAKRWHDFFSDVQVNLLAPVTSAQDAINALQAIVFDATMAIENIKREEV